MLERKDVSNSLLKTKITLKFVLRLLRALDDSLCNQVPMNSAAGLTAIFLNSKKKEEWPEDKVDVLTKSNVILGFMKHMAYWMDENTNPSNPQEFLLSLLAYLYDVNSRLSNKRKSQQFIMNTAIQLYHFAGPLYDFYGSWEKACRALINTTKPIGEVIAIAKLAYFLQRLLSTVDKQMLPQEKKLAALLQKRMETRNRADDRQVLAAIQYPESIQDAIVKIVQASSNLYDALLNSLMFVLISDNYLSACPFTSKRLLEFVASALHHAAGEKANRYGGWENVLNCDMTKIDREYYLKKIGYFCVCAYLLLKLKNFGDKPSLSSAGSCLFLSGFLIWQLAQPKIDFSFKRLRFFENKKIPPKTAGSSEVRKTVVRLI